MPRSTNPGGQPGPTGCGRQDRFSGSVMSEDAAGLYPPSITPPEQPLGFLRFISQFVVNPLRGLPRQVYEDDLTLYHPAKSLTVLWVCSPRLVEEVLVGNAGNLGKSHMARQVFAATLGDGVLTSEGPLWRWQRRVMAPLFRHGEILSYVPAIAQTAEEQLTQWRRAGPGPQPIDIHMTNATFTVIMRTMLVGGDRAEGEAIMRAGSDYLSRVSWEMMHALLHLPKWVPHPASRQMRRAAQEMRTALSDIIDRRRRSADGGTDLLARLLDARHPETGEPMTHDQLINNLSTLLEAGHETTAKALTWTLYLLARAPDWQQAVREEVRRVAGSEPISADHIDKLAITTRVLKEAMRLYPPVPVVAREASEPLQLGGISVTAGTQVVVPIFAIHRHRKYWDDPDRFDPNRFLPEREAKLPRTQFMPFGAGPRICIGQSFAMVEAVTLLATFVRGARFDWDGVYSPEPVSRITLRPRDGMPLTVTPIP